MNANPLVSAPDAPEDGQDEQTARPRVFYVNAYAVHLGYGGPEEGGWWFDVGVALASVPVTSDDEAERAKAALRVALAPDYEGQHPRSHTNGGPDLEVYIEDSFAANFPTRRPHYE